MRAYVRRTNRHFLPKLGPGRLAGPFRRLGPQLPAWGREGSPSTRHQSAKSVALRRPRPAHVFVT